jgi:hypothetical protein
MYSTQPLLPVHIYGQETRAPRHCIDNTRFTVTNVRPNAFILVRYKQSPGKNSDNTALSERNYLTSHFFRLAGVFMADIVVS